MANSLSTSVQGMAVQQQAMSDTSANLARQRVDASRSDKTLFVDNVRGVSAKSVALISGQGPLQSSDRDLDLAIDGTGFFVVERVGVTSFKRTMSCYTDKTGKLVDLEGNTLKGWPTLADGSIDTTKVTNQFQIAQLQDIFVNEVATVATATTNVKIGANLPATAVVGSTDGTQKTPVDIYDSLGNAHTMTLTWTKVNALNWDVAVTVTGASSANLDGTANPYILRVTFDGNGQPAGYSTVVYPGPVVTALAGGPVPIDITWAAGPSAPVNGSINLFLGDVGKPNGVTQIGDEYSASRPEADGVPFGSFSGVTVDDKGFVVAKFSNGSTTIVAKLALANFASTNNLARGSGNTLTQTNDSGPAVLFEPKTAGIGSIASKNLEGSLIDTATELTNMVLAQNAFTQNVKAFTIASESQRELNSIVR